MPFHAQPGASVDCGAARGDAGPRYRARIGADDAGTVVNEFGQRIGERKHERRIEEIRATAAAPAATKGQKLRFGWLRSNKRRLCRSFERGFDMFEDIIGLRVVGRREGDE
jgi:hypothetical protein